MPDCSVTRARLSLILRGPLVYFNPPSKNALGFWCVCPVYPALCCYLSRLAFQEGLLTNTSGLIALVLGGIIHACVVAAQVYFLAPFRRMRPDGRSAR